MASLIPPPRGEAYRRYKELSPEDHDYGYWWYVAKNPRRQVSPEGRRCLNLINWVWRGIYHAPYVEYANFSLDHVVLHSTSSLNTFDDDYLTRLVVAAHDFAIRIEIRASTRAPGPRLEDEEYPVVEVVMSPRDRAGQWHEYPQYHRHPTILQAVMTMHREEKYEVYQDPPLLGPFLELPRYTTAVLTHEDLNEVLACRHCQTPFEELLQEVIVDEWSHDVYHVECFAAHGVEGVDCGGVAL